MGSGKDYERARSRASQGLPTLGMPKNAAEAFGRAAGQAEYDRQRAPRQGGGSSGGDPGMSVGGYLLSLVVLFVLFMMAVHAGTIVKLFPVLIGVAALFLRKRARRFLGPLTPVYTGLCIAMILGSLELIVTGSRVNLHNLMIYLVVGAIIGALFIPVAIARQAKLERRTTMPETPERE